MDVRILHTIPETVSASSGITVSSDMSDNSEGMDYSNDSSHDEELELSDSSSPVSGHLLLLDLIS